MLTFEALAAIDDKLSQRYIALDTQGYFLIYVDRDAGLICAKHFTNTINERGLAVDPETGQVISVRGKVQRTHTAIFTGRTAKELCVEMFEKTQPSLVTCFDHAAYLGREFVRAESALISGKEYIQD